MLICFGSPKSEVGANGRSPVQKSGALRSVRQLKQFVWFLFEMTVSMEKLVESAPIVEEVETNSTSINATVIKIVNRSIRLKLHLS